MGCRKGEPEGQDAATRELESRQSNQSQGLRRWAVGGGRRPWHIYLLIALAFAAGAMIYVVVEELVPESQLESETDVATIGAMLGFAVMMTLDVALG